MFCSTSVPKILFWSGTSSVTESILLQYYQDTLPNLQSILRIFQNLMSINLKYEAMQRWNHKAKCDIKWQPFC
jgi:hypothetical protein